jgi:hypothetical protein
MPRAVWISDVFERQSLQARVKWTELDMRLLDIIEYVINTEVRRSIMQI